jgi:RHS repeat-associated protein
VDDYEVSYAYAKATSGRHSVRRSTMTTPGGNVITYSYAGNGNLHDWEANRVTQIKDGSVVLAHYDYNGGGHVVGIDLREADVYDFVYSGSTFPELDRHNRVIADTWTKDLDTDVDFYDVDITYEDDGTISLMVDAIWDGRDVEYTHDGLKRLTAAEEGTWTGSSITSKTRKQDWVALDQLGNWDEVTLDLNGDGDMLDGNEYDDDREHSIINELDQRNYDADYDTIVDTLNLSHDAAGNLIDDAEYYEYTYDAFNRLRLIELRGTSTVINEFRYNGLGHRIVADSSTADPVHLVYDERWRVVGRYVDTDSDPLEEFVYHAAGRDGRGGSSYIDHTLLRDKDTDANGVLDERIYYVHNWRNDVVALVTDTGEQVESVRYSAYGIPFGSRAGDTDNDGDVNGSASTDDTDQIQTWISTSTYDVRGDLDLNGVVNIDDLTAAIANAGTITGWKDLTSDDVGNDKGYAGCEFDDVIQRRWSTWHVRHRVLSSNLGRWMQRDPIATAPAGRQYDYGSNSPLSRRDRLGLTDYDVHPVPVPPGIFPGGPYVVPVPVEQVPPTGPNPGTAWNSPCSARRIVGENPGLVHLLGLVRQKCGGTTVDYKCCGPGEGCCPQIPVSPGEATPGGIASPMGCGCASDAITPGVITVCVCTTGVGGSGVGLCPSFSYEAVMSHELIHAWQYCSQAKVPMVVGGCIAGATVPPGGINVVLEMCMELGAWCRMYDGNCDGTPLCNSLCGAPYNLGVGWPTCFSDCMAMKQCCAGSYVPGGLLGKWWL